MRLNLRRYRFPGLSLARAVEAGIKTHHYESVMRAIVERDERAERGDGADKTRRRGSAEGLLMKGPPAVRIPSHALEPIAASHELNGKVKTG